MNHVALRKQLRTKIEDHSRAIGLQLIPGTAGPQIYSQSPISIHTSIYLDVCVTTAVSEQTASG
jgi:hypothetical protein